MVVPLENKGAEKVIRIKQSTWYNTPGIKERKGSSYPKEKCWLKRMYQQDKGFIRQEIEVNNLAYQFKREIKELKMTQPSFIICVSSSTD